MKKITRSGQYGGFAHHSPGRPSRSQPLDSESAAADLEHIALENPDGQLVLIVTAGELEDDRTAAREVGGSGSIRGKFGYHLGLEVVCPTRASLA
jgi:hypothetical protein